MTIALIIFFFKILIWLGSCWYDDVTNKFINIYSRRLIVTCCICLAVWFARCQIYNDLTFATKSVGRKQQSNWASVIELVSHQLK